MKLYNPWIELAIARKIAAEMQKRYCGQSIHEDEMLDYLWSHSDYLPSMWLDVHWDVNDCVCWIQIGTSHGAVPR